MATVGPGERPLPEHPAEESKIVEVVENVGAAERREREQQPQHQPAKEEGETSVKAAAGGSLLGALAGVTAVVLSILGLAGVEPLYLLAISVIAIGVALLAEGAAVASRSQQGTEMAEAGMSAECLAGVAGIVLGILALIGLSSLILIAAAVLVFGGALLLGAAATAEMARTVHPQEAAGETRKATMGASGAKVLAALAAIVLGILALVAIAPQMLLLVATLVLGGVLLLSGFAIGGRMMATMRS